MNEAQRDLIADILRRHPEMLAAMVAELIDYLMYLESQQEVGDLLQRVRSVLEEGDR